MTEIKKSDAIFQLVLSPSHMSNMNIVRGWAIQISRFLIHENWFRLRQIRRKSYVQNQRPDDLPMVG
jgi:hypothetical protein